MFIEYDKNECGTDISRYQCESCGDTFTVCPVSRVHDNWVNCLSEDCVSYDPSRDADIIFMSEKEIAERKSLVSLDMLRARKTLFNSKGSIK
jgi:predicted molibdopterin-dependent oxidoreductase YjgC